MSNIPLCPYGSHRVLDPVGALPQAARKLDNHMPMQRNEMRIAVETLNVDSASFTQIKEACGGDEGKMKQMILDIVAERGKMQNPVTGSGGMLLGTVSEVGPDFPGDAKPGDRVATLVSLSLTPLSIRTIRAIHMDRDQVDVEATAILFETGIWARIPDDMDRKVALAALDVAGAAAQVHGMVKPGDSVLILGASGKSGVLCGYEAMKKVGPKGNIVGVVRNPKQVDALMDLGVYHKVIVASATERRSQAQNKATALERLREKLEKRATVPKPRKKTKPTAGSQRRRFEGKKRLSAKKRERRELGEQ